MSTGAAVDNVVSLVHTIQQHRERRIWVFSGPIAAGKLTTMERAAKLITQWLPQVKVKTFHERLPTCGLFELYLADKKKHGHDFQMWMSAMRVMVMCEARAWLRNNIANGIVFIERCSSEDEVFIQSNIDAGSFSEEGANDVRAMTAAERSHEGEYGFVFVEASLETTWKRVGIRARAGEDAYGTTKPDDYFANTYNAWIKWSEAYRADKVHVVYNNERENNPPSECDSDDDGPVQQVIPPFKIISCGVPLKYAGVPLKH